MGLEDIENDSDPSTVIRGRIDSELVPLALDVNEVVADVVGEGNYRVKGSGDGVTFYPNQTSYQRYAFITLQPNRGGSYLQLHFDTSAKTRVHSDPIPTTISPRVREIPSNWKWSGSFRLSMDIEHASDIDEGVRDAIYHSIEQLRQ